MTRENKNKTIAIAVTVAIHVVAVLLLIYMALVTPLPLPGEAGVEVNLGMYNEGKGFQQQPKPKKVESVPVPETPPVKDRTVTQDTEETPAIEEVKPKKEETPEVNQRALFKMTNKTEESSSEGKTDKLGDQGSEHGSKDADSYTGLGGSGGGVSYDLGGRGMKSLNEPDKNKITEEGLVVVDIWVDRDGRVKRAQIGKGTDITNSGMREMALQSARSSIFAPDKDAAELQRGTITYRFLLRQ